MNRSLVTLLTLAGLLALAAPAALAGTDEFLGDSSIYAGVPTTSSRPNVLIIVDNSRSTENTAGGQPFKPWLYDDGNVITGPNVYPLGFELDNQNKPTTTPCTGNDPAKGCFLPWNIYELNNQGYFRQLTIANTSKDLTNLTCDPSGDSSKPIHKVLVEFGSYSGAASPAFPTIASNGSCITSGNANSGRTYALGNYLNYAKTTVAATPPAPVGVPDECKVPNPVVQACEWKENPTPAEWNCGNNKFAYFQLKTTHTSTDSELNSPYYGRIGTSSGAPLNPDRNYWTNLPTSPAPASSVRWDKNTTYTMTAEKMVDGKTCAQHFIDAGAPAPVPVTGLKTQREIMHAALSQVIKATAGVVNFGAMVYGGNNSGAKVVQSQYDSTFWTDMQDLSVGLTWDPANPPDCSLTSNASKNICKFIKALPGPGEADGAPRVSSNSNRPLAESVFDAGYYYGANYTSVTNTRRIPDAIKNPCDLNHIILLTNGFSNGDGSPKLSVIGDADGDGANEAVYGLGSHWLDDVARYLKANHKVTTHTVLAFQSTDALIQNAAADGGGEFYNVNSAEELSAALLRLMANIINASNTSFVAPVVPASTTNRTISSNKVYLGLFRPQQDGPWRGNIKKYGISLTTFNLTDRSGAQATYPDGSFLADSVSHWSLNAASKVPTATTTTGLIDPVSGTVNDNGDTVRGDGGQVDSGGAGGVLLDRMKGLLADIKSSGNWQTTNAKWRNIYTYLPASGTKELWNSGNRFVPWNANITVPILDLYDNSVSPPVLRSLIEREKTILFTHGFDVEQPLVTAANVGVRKWVLGDLLHSRPLVFNYAKYPELADGTCPPNGNTDITSANTWNSSVVFAGANDGMLHAFRDCDGQELWAFIPPNVLKYLQYIKNPESGHATFVDSAPTILVYDQNEDGTINPGTDKVVLIVGQRRGGGKDTLDSTSSRGAYYALDVSNPYQPKLLWEFDNAVLSELGETWSQPRLAKVKVDADNFKLVAFVGIGYDNNEDFRFGNTQTFPDTASLNLNTDASPGGTVDGSGIALMSSGSVAAESRNAPRGRGIVAIEVAHYERASSVDNYVPSLSGGTVGTPYWSYTNSDSTSTDLFNTNLKYSFPTDLTVLDLDGNSYADTIYAGDTGGNLWRFDISASSKSSWSGEILFSANPGNDNIDDALKSKGRKIFYRPAVAMFGAPHVYFGTGDREHPLNRSTTDRLYCVIDWKKAEQNLGTYNQSTYPLKEGDLEDMTLNPIQELTISDTNAKADEWRKRLYSSPGAPYNPLNTFHSTNNYTYGWYIKLDGTDRIVGGDPGEKMLAAPTVFNGQVFFSTYQLYTGKRAGCDAGNLGISRLYQLNYKTGEAVENFDPNNDISTAAVLPGNERAVGKTVGDKVQLLQRTDRYRRLGEGIPSGVVTLIDASGRVTQLTSSSDKVEASAMTDIKLISPVYWMQW